MIVSADLALLAPPEVVLGALSDATVVAGLIPSLRFARREDGGYDGELDLLVERGLITYRGGGAAPVVDPDSGTIEVVARGQEGRSRGVEARGHLALRAEGGQTAVTLRIALVNVGRGAKADLDELSTAVQAVIADLARRLRAHLGESGVDRAESAWPAAWVTAGDDDRAGGPEVDSAEAPPPLPDLGPWPDTGAWPVPAAAQALGGEAGGGGRAGTPARPGADSDEAIPEFLRRPLPGAPPDHADIAVGPWAAAAAAAAAAPPAPTPSAPLMPPAPPVAHHLAPRVTVPATISVSEPGPEPEHHVPGVVRVVTDHPLDASTLPVGDTPMALVQAEIRRRPWLVPAGLLALVVLVLLLRRGRSDRA